MIEIERFPGNRRVRLKTRLPFFTGVVNGRIDVFEFTTGSIDYARCNGGSFAFFEADPGTAHVEISGILERWWVVDLDGTPVIVGTAAGPKATPAEADAIKAIAQGRGIRIPLTACEP